MGEPGRLEYALILTSLVLLFVGLTLTLVWWGNQDEDLEYSAVPQFSDDEEDLEFEGELAQAKHEISKKFSALKRHGSEGNRFIGNDDL